MKKHRGYDAKKVKADGYVFDSMLEYEKYQWFKILLKAGKIKTIEVHKRFDLLDGIYLGLSLADIAPYIGKRKFKNDLLLQRKMFYICDFYITENDGSHTVYDVKCPDRTIKAKSKFFVTSKFRMKVKLMKFIHNIEVKVI